MIADIWNVVSFLWVFIGSALFLICSIAYAAERERWQARLALTGLFLPLAVPFWLAVLLWFILKGIYRLFVVAFSKESS